MGMLAAPLCVHVVPSGAVYPVMVLPLRTSRTQYGAVGPLVLLLTLLRSVLVRN